MFIEALVRLVQRLTTQVSELSELDGSTRLYRQLWRLGDVYEKHRAGAELPISQQQLASMTGVGLRITNRVLNEARLEGTLETGKKRIVDQRLGNGSPTRRAAFPCQLTTCWLGAR